MKPTGFFERRSMFIECHLWVRFWSVAEDIAENNTQKPQVQSLTWAFPTLFFSFVLPSYPECPPQIIMFHYPAWFFSKELTILWHSIFLSFSFLSFFVFLFFSLSYFVSFCVFFLSPLFSSLPSVCVTPSLQCILHNAYVFVCFLHCLITSTKTAWNVVVFDRYLLDEFPAIMELTNFPFVCEMWRLALRRWDLSQRSSNYFGYQGLTLINEERRIKNHKYLWRLEVRRCLPELLIRVSGLGSGRSSPVWGSLERHVEFW